MKIEIDSSHARFLLGDHLAGTYVLNDPFKPFFSELRTPLGHNTVVVSPGDHRHHKGLMYGLCCEDLSFWEEDPGTGSCGVQEIISTQVEASGLRQELLWREESGLLPTYEETRTIGCSHDVEGKCFVWKWTTERKALRDHRLIQSHWAHAATDGRVINYHGLGIRLPWMWCFGFEGDEGQFGTLEVNGEPKTEKQAHGTRAPEIGMVGLIDGQWEPTRARVTLAQQEGFAWYAVRGAFPYLAAGPTCEGSLAVSEGETFRESYIVRVADVV